MHRRAFAKLLLAGACLVGLGAAARTGRTEAPTPKATRPASPFTPEDRKTFDELYKPRIAKAASRKAKNELARELLAAAEKLSDGLKHLLLTATKDLATDGGDLGIAVDAQQRLVEMAGGEATDLLTALVELQIRHFNVLKRKRVPSKQRDAMKRTVFALGGRIVDNAVSLGNTHRARLDFAEAEKAERLAVGIAQLVSSPRLAQLRQGILLSQTLKGIAGRAEMFKRRDMPERAVWEYLDAGMVEHAAALKPAPPDETAALLVSVGLDDDANAADLLDAAKAWDQRSVTTKGPLVQIRLMRAAQLYQRYMAVGDEAGKKLASVRLQAINQELGDLQWSLRPPAAWTYLVDLKEVSAKVGWGSFKKYTVAKGPANVAGRKFPTGMMVHAGSRVVYSLRGRYRLLSIHYGMAPWAGGAAWFEILCDGKRAWKSGGMWKNHTHGVRKPTLISLVGVDKLELVTHGIAGGAGAHSMWGDPKVR